MGREYTLILGAPTWSKVRPQMYRSSWIAEARDGDDYITVRLISWDAYKRARDLARKEQGVTLNAGMYSSKTDAWDTPPDLYYEASVFLGPDFFDPAPSGWDGLTDSLALPWHGPVYLNPPYGRRIAAWTNKLIESYLNGEVSEAVLLVPARTDTKWGQAVLTHGRAVVFVAGRLHFSESENAAPFPSMLVYFGDRVPEFKQAFKSRGAFTRVIHF